MTTSIDYNLSYLPPNKIKCVCRLVAENIEGEREISIALTVVEEFDRSNAKEKDYQQTIADKLTAKVNDLFCFMTTKSHIFGKAIISQNNVLKALPSVFQ